MKKKNIVNNFLLKVFLLAAGLCCNQSVGYFNFGFIHVHRCVLALYTRYFPELCENKSQVYYVGGIRTHDLCNSRAVGYCLLCPVVLDSVHGWLARVSWVNEYLDKHSADGLKVIELEM